MVKLGTNKQRGSTPSLIMVSILILVTIIAASQFFSPTYRPTKGSVAEIRNEFSSSLDKGITLGINKLMLSGDSNNTDAWYCNMAYPPDVNEVINSSEFFFKQEIGAFLEELSKKHNLELKDGWSASLWLEDIETNPMINPQIHDVGFLTYNLPDKKVTVKINNLFVRYADDETIKEIDLSGYKVFDYRIWYFYKKLAIWINEDAARITQKTCDWLGKGQCQMTKATCQVGHKKIDPPLIPEENIENQFPLELMVKSAMDESVNALNNMFQTEDVNVTCTSSLISLSSDIKYHRLQRCIPSSTPICEQLRLCNMQGVSQDYRCPAPECSDEFDKDFGSGLLPTLNCPNNPNAEFLREPWIFSEANQDNNPTSPTIADTPLIPKTDIRVDCSTSEYKVENITAQPEATALFAVECKDKSIRIPRPESYDYLTNRFKLRIALKLNCDCKGQAGCGELSGDPGNLFREIPCAEYDPLVCLFEYPAPPPGPPGPEPGPGPGPGPKPPGPICPPCGEIKNHCYTYNCVGGECVRGASICSDADNACFTKKCVLTNSGEPCNTNDPSAACSCKITQTPEGIACTQKNSPCTQYYCGSGGCVAKDICSGSTACTEKVCVGKGTPSERCETQEKHTCSGSSTDPCIINLNYCALCSSSDPTCPSSGSSAGWTCTKLRCPTDRYQGCVADSSQSGGYRCIGPSGGG